MMAKQTVGIIGCGVVGSAVGVVLQSKGYPLIGVADQNRERRDWLASHLDVDGMSSEEVARRAEILFVTTTDGAIAAVTRELAEASSFKSGQVVLQMSGALTSEVLKPAAKQGAICLSLHPLQSFAAVEQAIQILPGSVFSIEGDPAGFALGAQLVADLEGEFFYIDQQAKPLYHAGAVVVSNYLVTLIDLGQRLFVAAGIPEDKALAGLLPLIEGTLKNIRKLGIPQALTGPIARGDTATIEKHLATMEQKAAELLGLYCSLGYQTVEVAERKGGITESTAQELRQILKQPPQI